MARMKKQSYTFLPEATKIQSGGPASVSAGSRGCKHRKSRPAAGRFRNSASQNFTGLKCQGLGLFDLRQRLHLGEHVRRHRAVDLDQSNGVTARFVAAEMEGRDVDPGIAKQAREVADEARLVLIGDVDHR